MQLSGAELNTKCFFRIHEGLVEIMKLNLKYADAITEIQQGEEPTLEQSLQIASSTKMYVTHFQMLVLNRLCLPTI